MASPRNGAMSLIKSLAVFLLISAGNFTFALGKSGKSKLLSVVWRRLGQGQLTHVADGTLQLDT